MKTIHLNNLLPRSISSRLARSRLRRAYRRGGDNLPRLSDPAHWTFDAKDRQRVLSLIKKH